MTGFVQMGHIMMFIVNTIFITRNLLFKNESVRYELYVISSCMCFPGEAVNNAAGFGFNGYKNGEARWDLLTNVNILKIEVSCHRTDRLNTDIGIE